MTSVASATESWRTIPGYGSKYEASNLGQVRVVATGLVKATSINRGYLQTNLYYKGRHTSKIHALVIAAFRGPRPDGQDVRHVDGDQRNNHESNLRYGTRSENMQDRHRHGTARNAHTGQTHCKRGHAFTPENTWQHHEGGKRACKTCQRLREVWKMNGLWDYETKSMIKPPTAVAG